jgi:hypothetical protein
MLPVFVSAHVGCCGDIPESLIWAFTFFLLIGLVVVGMSYSSFPSQPSYETVPPTVMVKIDHRDLVELGELIKQRH